ncbi:Putative transmembrane protein [Chlamydia avium 10DC88]|uniref:Transmembrane protein n=2 Tax=Chlamydia avium TaxID=1457141 RepID=W8JQV9_9CHLA|nr:Putative transmembrane protein [Chlamydia avium 10DC88]
MMKRVSWFKTLGIALSLGIFVFFLPTLLSIGSGKYLVLSLIHKETGLSCTVEDLKLSWWGPQSAKKVKIIGKDNQGELFSAETINIEGSLPRLLLYQNPKAITLSGWSLQIDENLTIDQPSIGNLDPGAIFAFLSNSSSVTSEHGSVVMKTVKGDTLFLSGFYVEKTPQKLIVKGVATEGNVIGRIFIESRISPEVNISAQLESVPASFIKLFIAHPTWDRIFSHESVLNAQVSASNVNGKVIMTAEVTGSQMQAKLKGHIHQSTFYVTEGSTSFLEVQPQLASFLCSEILPSSTKISSQQIRADISHAIIPLDIFKWKHSEISLHAYLHSLSFSPKDPNLSIELKNSEISLKKNIRYTRIQGSSLAVFGGAAQSYIHGSLTIDNKKNHTEFLLQQPTLPHTYLRALFPQPFVINIPLEVPYYSLEVRGEYKRSQIVAFVDLDNPLMKLRCMISGTLQSMLFQGNATYHFEEKLRKNFSQHFSYAEADFSGKLQAVPTHIYFPKFSMKMIVGENEIFLHGKFGKVNEPIRSDTCSTLIYGKIVSLPLSIVYPQLMPLNLTKASFSLHTDGGKSLAKGNIQMMLEDMENPDLPSTRILIPEFIISIIDPEKPISVNNVKVQGSGEVIDFPLDRLLKIQQKEGKLSTYIGATGTMGFNLRYDPEEEDLLTFDSSLKTDALSGDFTFIMDHSLMLSSKTKGTLQWEITPERYASFFSNSSCFPSCTLHRTAITRIDISKLSCAEHKTGLSCLSLLTEGGFEGALSTNPLIFYDNVSKETFIINNFIGSISSNNLDTKIQYDFQGSCLAPSQENNKTSAEFFIRGSVENILDFSQREFIQTAEWKHIPSSFITGIFPISPDVKTKISSLAGPRIRVKMFHHLLCGEGPFTVNVDSANLQAYIPLIIKEKAILLEEDLQATLQINEEINRAFFQEFNPLISGSAYSKHPVLLRVNKENFYLPISPYSFEEFHIQSATLDFGKISIANTGTMYDLFQFLDIEENKQFVESWFTPIFFSVQKGSIICKRFDALIDNRIRLALWGKTNILKDRISMTLGIDPEVIKKYFHNTSLRTKNFFLIKIRGSISSPEVDWSSAYARIALLKSYMIASPFNTLADKLFSSLGDSTPPQTVFPLPWEKSQNSP